MGFDTHMIAGSRACPTSRPAHSPDHHQPVKPALCGALINRSAWAFALGACTGAEYLGGHCCIWRSLEPASSTRARKRHR